MSSKKMLAALPLAAICLMPHHASAQDQQGMVVVRDARTGQLRAPTAAESRALAPKSTAAMAAPARPNMVTHPGGARQVRLGERGLVYAVVTRDGDGKLSDQCIHDEQAAEHAVHDHAAHSRQAGQAGQATQAHDDKEGRHEVR
ncbi:post-PEP-CTERM-1 domain-containing protein [Massilia brevitalea]|uniref:post-PEP-CTERM-1 domain-containing protein n=1 Tax=Massilia brevitalea TaxID=442526 RepID=UPI00273A4280|nr:hypothetical protein [Massilia brevitalea]